MTWFVLLAFTVAAFGFAYVAGHSVITRPLRTWIAGEPRARCPICGVTRPASWAIETEDQGIAVCSGTDEDDAHERAQFQLGYNSPVRGAIVTLLECPACLGWWTGLIAGVIALVIVSLAFNVWPAAASARVVWALGPLALAFYTAGSNYLLGRATGLMPLE